METGLSSRFRAAAHPAGYDNQYLIFLRAETSSLLT